MATISNGESGSSVRTKLNEIINKVEGVTSINNNIDVTGTITSDGLTVNGVAEISAPNTRLNLYETDATDTNTQLQSSNSRLMIKTLSDDGLTATERLRVDHTTGDISFYEDTGTTPKMVWKSAEERLGIGTDSPSESLTVFGAATFSRFSINSNPINTASVAQSFARFKNTGGDFYLGIEGGTGGAFFPGSTAYGAVLYNANATPLSFYTYATERMRIESSGLIKAVASIASDPTDTGAYWYNKSGVGPTLSGFQFSVRTGGTPTEAIRIDSNGNLLVGKASDNQALAGVKLGTGGSNMSRDNEVLVLNRLSTDGTILNLKKDGATVGSIGSSNSDLMLGNSDVGLKFHDANDKIYPWNVSTDAIRDGDITLGDSAARFKDLYLSGSIHGDVKFENNAGTTEYARFDSSGNLLVGTPNPAYSFDKIAVVPTSSNGTGIGIAVGNFDVRGIGIYNGYTATGTATAIQFQDHLSTTRGSITVTTSATAYNTTSDYRLKEDVQPMVGASDRVLALNPVNFAWKADGSRVDGFIAHEAQAVVPEAVTGEKDAVDAEGNPEYQGIDQSKLVPLLTAALQEALTEIADLKARVAALEA